MTNFNLTATERKQLLNFTIKQLENYYATTKDYKVSPKLDIKEIVAQVRKIDFTQPVIATEAIQNVLDGLTQYAVHVPHPKYFGLFNPRTTFPSILADLITATFNPQMAAWSHAPYSVEVENYVISELGKQFGYTQTDGVFTSGGAEANLTAVLCALHHHFPKFSETGAFGLQKLPVIYCSGQAHHSIQRAARCAGLGAAAVRSVPVREDLKMDIAQLETAIKADIENGHHPFMLVGTAGTTGTGVIDELDKLKVVAKQYQMWYHVDAAWGGAAVLSPDLKPHFKGIESSDSITCDAHKWLNMPMGTGMFFTQHPNILSQTFSILTDYMPKEGKDLQIVDPYTHSIQWSRRSLGIRLYLTLQIFGWEGYAQNLAHQTEVGAHLKKCLEASNWSIKNETPLPVLCFTDTRYEQDPTFTERILQHILAEGKTWISLYPVHGISTLRACITNFSTSKVDVEELVKELNEARTKL